MNYYGHNFITRNLVVSFMDWFSRINIEKYGTATVSGNEVYVSRKVFPVPIQWCAREKWVEILRSSSARKAMDPAIREKNPVEMQWILPRLSCNLNSITYDASRKLPKTQDIGRYVKGDPPATLPTVLTPTPYNLEIELTSVSRNMDDNMQIMEQIIPFFAPSLSLNLYLYPDRNSDSIPITLDSITPDIPIDLPENDERLFTTTYRFTMKANYFPIQHPDAKVIWNIDTNLVTDITVTNINIKWLEEQQKIQTKFDMYQAASTIPNPFLGH